MFGQGNFVTGCNYWASHAGTEMWHDWRPDIVEADFVRLEALRLQVVRIFPLWPNFQPLHMLYGCSNTQRELSWPDCREVPVDADGIRSGVDPVMLERFRFVCDCAQRHRLKLGIGLVTGWMSGRLFAPPAFADRNLLTDPEVIRWQLKLVKRVVGEFCDHPAIAFWGIGNECNCLSPADRQESNLWASIMADAIRVADHKRHPIAAGMHSLVPVPALAGGRDGGWTIQDMGEIFDALTTHPYPAFTPHASVDRVNGFKNVFHATAESHFFGDIGHKPCIAEELGTLSPMIAAEQPAADYLRNTMFQLWSHDCEGLLWWCAFDQLELERPPYRWCALERELGLIRNDGSVKPVGEVMREFAGFLEHLPFERLPRFRTDAVCVLTEGQDSWRAAWGAWCLAKQAGFDLEFQYCDEALREADLYLVPSVAGMTALPRPLSQALLERARAGATVYFSHDNALLSPFEPAFGVEALGRTVVPGEAVLRFEAETLPVCYDCHLQLRATTAEVLATEADGNVVLACNRYGAGMIYFLSVPLEKHFIETPQSWNTPYWKFYSRIAKKQLARRLFHSGNPLVTATEHHFDSTHAAVAVVNNSDAPAACNGFRCRDGVRVTGIYPAGLSELVPATGMVLLLETGPTA